LQQNELAPSILNLSNTIHINDKATPITPTLTSSPSLSLLHSLHLYCSAHVYSSFCNFCCTGQVAGRSRF